VILTLKNLADS